VTTRPSSRPKIPRPYDGQLGLRAVLEYAREADVIVVHPLDRFARTLRDKLNLIHELSERGVGMRNLADPIRVDALKRVIVTLVAALSLLGAVLASSTHARIPTPSAAERAFKNKMARSDRSSSYKPMGNYGANCQQIVTKYMRLCTGFIWERHRSSLFIVRRCDASAHVSYVNLSTL